MNYYRGSAVSIVPQYKKNLFFLVGSCFHLGKYSSFRHGSIVVYLLGVHNRSINLLSWSASTSIRLGVCVFVLLYLFIQLNFDLVSHNFGTRTHQFVNSYYSYLAGLGILIVSLSKLWWVGSYSLYSLRVRARIGSHHLIVRSILFVTSILVLASLIDLFISFT